MKHRWKHYLVSRGPRGNRAKSMCICLVPAGQTGGQMEMRSPWYCTVVLCWALLCCVAIGVQRQTHEGRDKRQQKTR